MLPVPKCPLLVHASGALPKAFSLLCLTVHTLFSGLISVQHLSRLDEDNSLCDAPSHVLTSLCAPPLSGLDLVYLLDSVTERERLGSVWDALSHALALREAQLLCCEPP